MSKELLDALDATWAPAQIKTEGPWLIRDGQGGGKRVSATSAITPPSDKDIQNALHRPLFMIRPTDLHFDKILEKHEYQIIDPVDIFTTKPKPSTLSYASHSNPTPTQKRIWAEGGIGDARLQVMARSAEPRAYLEIPDGTAFVSTHKKTAMVHAIEISANARRQGKGRHIVTAASDWAFKNGANILALAVTKANKPAQSLYRALGMKVEAYYHYRIKDA